MPHYPGHNNATPGGYSIPDDYPNSFDNPNQQNQGGNNNWMNSLLQNLMGGFGGGGNNNNNNNWWSGSQWWSNFFGNQGNQPPNPPNPNPIPQEFSIGNSMFQPNIAPQPPGMGGNNQQSPSLASNKRAYNQQAGNRTARRRPMPMGNNQPNQRQSSYSPFGGGRGQWANANRNNRSGGGNNRLIDMILGNRR